MKSGLQTGRIAGATAAAAALSSCFGLTVTGTTFNGRGTVASSSQTSTASGGTSGGIGASSSGSGTGGSSPSGSGTGGSNSSGGAGSTTGSTTGGSSTGFADGGYVFCTIPGLPTWLCTPGTYFCDPSDAGVCFQCLSDADCADQGRPTYDPLRPRCDLHSGVTGYQNFCQVCLANGDCASNPSGPLCDISPYYPGAAIEPSIVDLGFETCGKLQSDCRVDGGPICKDAENERCEPDSGVCELLNGLCSTDADCVGYFAETFSFPLVPRPYCVMGQCGDCLNGICPNSYCSQDSNCVNPISPAGMAACNETFGQCGCVGDLQCSGLWPKCELLDAGYTTDAGLPLGICGCDQDAQCGDGGRICSHGFCGVLCTASDAPACSSVPDFPPNRGPALNPICNSSTGLCEPCSSDQQCRSDPGSGGPICSDGGLCGCMTDGDCPTNQICQAQPPGNNPWDPVPSAICVPSFSRCTPDSCVELFCDWQTGECLDAGSSFNAYNERACLTDYDCVTAPYSLYAGSFCDPVTHLCGSCNTDADCAGLSNTKGFHCFREDAGVSSCGCLSDVDCAGNLAGSACDTTPSDPAYHSCGCRTPTDCQPDQACLASFLAQPFTTCGTVCASDSDCNSGYACDPGDTCRARCDTQPCPTIQPACDGTDVVGQNGRTATRFENGVTWCYQCLVPSECGSSGCDSSSHQCGACQAEADCPAGETCRGRCVATCDAVPCPAGQVCDTNNLAGGGPDLCYECVSPIDCPNGEGCSSYTHTCGRCDGPNASGQPYSDCPPGAVCSNYWSGASGQEGVCLAGCDLSSCPADQPICAVLPALTPDHKYCFGCLQDSDCVSFGAGAWCDVSVGLTFSCQVAH